MFSVSAEKTSAATFKDVPQSSDTYKEIEWASKEGILNGFPTGEFKPNNTLTLAQFAKLTKNFFHLQNSTYQLQVNGGTNFFNPHAEYYKDATSVYFDALAAYNVPYMYYHSLESQRNKPITRGLVAQVFGYLINGNPDLPTSIHFLSNQGITKMADPTAVTIENQFNVGGELTRAQIVRFFYRLNEKNMRTVHSKAQTAFDRQAADEAAFNKAAAGLDAQINRLVHDTVYYQNNYRNFSPEVKKQMNDILQTELAVYGLKVNGVNSLDPLSYSVAKKFLSKLSAKTLKTLKDEGFELISSSHYVNKELKMNEKGIMLEDKEKGFISIAQINPNSYNFSVAPRKDQYNEIKKNLPLYTSIYSDFAGAKITPAMILEFESRDKKPFHEYITKNKKVAVQYFQIDGLYLYFK